MKVCIHRGTEEIGGNCIELDQDGKRIVLDIGLPLDAGECDDKRNLLPRVKGFKEKDDSLLSVIISHPHQDHFGLATYLRSEIPVAIGSAATRILEIAAHFSPAGASFKNNFPLENGNSLTFGPFRITPFLVDHSAYDAYSILVEAGGKRLFYSGDFRAHGRKANLFEKLIKEPPKDIDVLLMEGTIIGRNSKKEPTTEDDLISEFQNVFKNTEGLCMVWTSSQNIDRIVTIYKACKMEGRRLIMDLYTAEILRATGNRAIPQGTWAGVKLFLTEYQRRDVKRKGIFEEVNRYRINRIYPENLAEEAANSVLLFRPKMAGDLEKTGCLKKASLIYSLWEGYLNMDSQRSFRHWMDGNQIPLTKIHTSGHASVKDLERFAKAINPKVLVPIHTFHPKGFETIFPRLEFKKDCEWWEIN
ncbi:MBL fold metallo-hydrolase [candidate division KSB1 bacterium]|nr:MBL fold metallo-hydrolase [candidate division KSB1 bacterium]